MIAVLASYGAPKLSVLSPVLGAGLSWQLFEGVCSSTVDWDIALKVTSAEIQDLGFRTDGMPLNKI